MISRLRVPWDLPRADGAVGPMRRDWILVGALLIALTVEAFVRTDIAWRLASVALAVVIVFYLPWRRVQPGRCVAIAFGSIVVVQVLSIAFGTGAPVGMKSSACVLIIAFACARWGSGREITLLVSLLVVLFGLGYNRDYKTVTDAIAEVVILSFAVILGLAVRAQVTSRARDLERVRMSEREQLARELHDTVAHHVSAMVVRAQAGRVVAETRPEAAVEALRVIEEEGSRTLAEMRVLVGALRDDGDSTLAPAASVLDIQGLAAGRTGPPEVRVSIDADAEVVHPSVASALYRIAQESVTNATRHAAGATLVEVTVKSEGANIRLAVHDNGTSKIASGAGYGIVGMSERAALLGGSLEAGPAADGGWLVEAVLPRTGVAR